MIYSDKLKYIHKYLTNELSSSEREAFVTWINESEDNKRLYEQIDGIWDNATYIQDEPFDFQQAFNRHVSILENEKPVEKEAKVVQLFGLRSIAAVMLLLVMSVVVFKWMNGGKTYDAINGDMTIVLEDGTKVWLEKESELKILSNNADGRLVKLIGKAFFDVSRNENAPFVIETQGVDVRVLGTQFLVDTKTSKVDVKEGKVEVTHGDEAVVLTKNQSVSLNNNQLTSVFENQFDNSQLWFNEELKFDNVAFDKVIEDISKEYKLTISLPTQNSWAECTFTSGALKGNTFEQILIILEVTYDLEYTKTSNDSYSFTKVNCK